MTECSKGAGAGCRVPMMRCLMGLSSKHQRRLPDREACQWLPLVSNSIPQPRYTQFTNKCLHPNSVWLHPFPFNPSQNTLSLPFTLSPCPESSFRKQSQKLCCGRCNTENPAYFGFKQLGFVCFSNKIDRLTWKNDLHLFTIKALNFLKNHFSKCFSFLSIKRVVFKGRGGSRGLNSAGMGTGSRPLVVFTRGDLKKVTGQPRRGIS